MRRLLPFMLVLLALAVFPTFGQKTQSWRETCRAACSTKYNTCLQEAQGNGPDKDQCRRNYRGCVNWCLNPPRSARP